MIEVYLVGHDLEYECKDILNLFFNQEITFVESVPESIRNTFVMSKAEEISNVMRVSVQLSFSEKDYQAVSEKEFKIDSAVSKKRALRRTVKQSLFKALEVACKKTIPWGTLTGVRPTKVVAELLDLGLTGEGLISRIQKDYRTTLAKAQILAEIATSGREIIKSNNPNSASIYVGIPFCPDRCLYCSFPSSPVKMYEKKLDEFMDCLLHEIVETGKAMRERGLEVETIYIGGGTPTVLDAEKLKGILEQLDQSFSMNRVNEVTLEAGRPDTIDKKKLEIAKKFGVSRLSINPQTMNAETLKLIGRNHTVEDIERAFHIAREVGFDNINMDLIAGLPGETVSDMAYTLEQIKRLAPESITVHTLAVKKGSRLMKEDCVLPEANEVEEMLEMARNTAEELGMKPYYMYRQKNMIGLQENVGYCVAGKECIYNIKMIEEIQHIVAFGPGGVSRFINYETKKIHKVFNDRSIEGYMGRSNEMVAKKQGELKANLS